MQLDLPSELSACTPLAAGTFAGSETLAIAGPVAVLDNLVVAALTCPAASNVSVHLFGWRVANSSGVFTSPIPSLAWHLSLRLPSAVPPPRWLTMDPTAAPLNATVLWVNWGEELLAVDGGRGTVEGRLNLTALVWAGGGACAAAADGGATAEGPPLASQSGAGPQLMLPLALSDTTHAVALLDVPSPERASVLWCVLTPGDTPGAHAAQGQAGIVTGGAGGGNVAAFVTRDGVFGIA